MCVNVQPSVLSQFAEWVAPRRELGDSDIVPVPARRRSAQQSVAGFFVVAVVGVQSAGGGLGERHGTFIFAAPVHVCVRRQFIQGRSHRLNPRPES